MSAACELCVFFLAISYPQLRTGLPPSINDPNDSDSDSEPEDEDDEDSNGNPNRLGRYHQLIFSIIAEDYYKNEYPEEESDYLSSGGFTYAYKTTPSTNTEACLPDEFHEDSDYDDFLKDEMDDADDHDWR